MLKLKLRATKVGTALPALLLLLALQLSACGGGDDTPVVDDPSKPPTGTETATDCLNVAAYAQGYTASASYAGSGSSGGQPVPAWTTTKQSTVNGTANLNGMQAVRVQTIETYSNDPAVLRTVGYNTVQGTQLLDHGVDTVTAAGGLVFRVSNNPAISVDFGMKVGQTSSQALVETSFDPSDGQSTNRNFQQVTTLVGLETVTVPAGTFQKTCHFSLLDTSGNEVSVVQAWLAAGSGVVVKLQTTYSVAGRVEQDLVEVLSAATVNGAALRP